MSGEYDTESAMFKVNDLPTRGHPRKLQKGKFKTEIRKHYFSQRIVNLWNSLPEPVVMAPSINTFKNRLDKHWKNMKFLYDDFKAVPYYELITTNPRMPTEDTSESEDTSDQCPGR